MAKLRKIVTDEEELKMIENLLTKEQWYTRDGNPSLPGLKKDFEASLESFFPFGKEDKQ